LAARDFGGSMRLGSYPCVLREGSVALAAYKKFSSERVRVEKVGKGKDAQTVYVIDERHRHRYEVNPEYVQQIADAGLVFSGTSPDGTLMEIAELPKSEHPFFVATQFHPEFLARPLAPHALFSGLIRTCRDIG
jgi:CTP synthase